MANHTIAAGTTLTAGYTPGTGSGFTLSVYGVAGSTIAAYGALLTGAGDQVYIGSTGIAASNPTTGVGVGLTAGGGVGVTAGGTIGGSAEVKISGAAGTLVNDGHITGTKSNAVYLADGGVVTNQGSGVISAPAGYGVLAKVASVVTNLAGGTISGKGGISLAASGTVINAGYLGTSHGVLSAGRISVTNTGSGTIKGSSSGVVARSGGGDVTNQSGGTIIGSGYDGVYLKGGTGSVTNAGLISSAAGKYGVFIKAAPGIVTNQGGGTISGKHDAVLFSAGYANSLVDDPGAVFIGTVDGGNTLSATSASTLELASGSSAGMLSGFGSQFLNFGDLVVDSGASWTLAAGTGAGMGTVVSAVTLTDNGTLTNDGTILTQVTLGSGAVLTNASGASISTSDVAVDGSGLATVVNAGQISSSSGGLFLGQGSITNLSTGTIAGGDGVGVFFQDATGTVRNQGRILGGGSTGVLLGVGGTVTNLSGTISGLFGVEAIAGAAGTVVNAATIIGTGGPGVSLASGGYVTNQTGGTISGTTDGVRASGAAAVVNQGSISGTAAGSFGVDLSAGGTVANLAGTISGAGGGVHDSGGTVINAATILGTAQSGVVVGGGTVSNQSTGTIGGGQYGVLVNGNGTVLNAGTITGTAQFGVAFNVNGYLSNASGGVIGGNHGVGFVSNGLTGADTVVNAGSIGGGVQLRANNTNRVVVVPGAVFIGTVDGGNTIGNTVATSTLELTTGASVGVVGTVSGLGSQYIDFGIVTVDLAASWTLASGTVASGVALADKGTLTNAGVINAPVTLTPGAVLINVTDASIASGRGAAVNAGLDATATVVNAGTIDGTSIFGVDLSGGGSVTNNGSGVIHGAENGIAGYFLETDVTNLSGGTISGAAFNGILIDFALGSVTNAGSIAGGNYGLNLGGGGAVVNQIGGMISAGGTAVVVAGGAGTVTDAGTIISTGDAVSLGVGFTNQVIVDPGAVFVGTVDGGNAPSATSVSTLELASGELASGELASGTSVGTLSGLGTQFIDFAQVRVDAGAVWTLSSGGSVAAGVTLTNAGTINGPVTLGAGALLYNATNASISSSLPPAAYRFAGGSVYGLAGGTETVVNAGSITATGKNGIDLKGVGSVTNLGSGVVSAGSIGVRMYGGGSLINSGLLTATNIGGYGVVAVQPSSITNTGSGTITAEYTGLAFFSSAVPGTNNVINQSGGTISGTAHAGVDVNGSLVSITNAGVILSAAGDGVNNVLGGGQVLNQDHGTISGGQSGIYLFLASGTDVTNQSGGTISGTASSGVGFDFTAGSLTNAGVVQSMLGNGVQFAQAGGTITNQSGGTISGGVDAVQFAAGYTNLLVIDPGAVFSGKVDGGNASTATSVSTLELASATSAGTLSGLGTQFIDFANVSVDSGAAWTLSGGGTIAAGVILNNAGTLTDADTLTNAGLITGSVTLAAGAVLNNVTNASIFSTQDAAVYGATTGAGTVVNAAGITGIGAYGVYLRDGGSVTNDGTGVIDGGTEGIKVTGGSASIVNQGSIVGTTGHGVYLTAGGAVTNSGTGAGIDGVAAFNAAVTVSNQGSIVGTANYGVITGFGGTVTNSAGALISGGVDGVWGQSGGALTVSNQGTISGGTDAVRFSPGFANRLIDDPGAVFIGTVDGGNPIAATSVSTLELASGSAAGTVTGFGSQYVNFGNVVVDARAVWTLAAGTTAGMGTVVSGVTLTVDGRLTNDATVLTTVTLGAGGVVTNSAGALIAGAGDGVFDERGAATVSNQGSIVGASNYGVIAGFGGIVTNSAGAFISGGVVGVYGQSGGVLTVSNHGTISGASLRGVELIDGGAVTNSGTGASIIGGQDGVAAFDAAATVANQGIISGGSNFAVVLSDGGAVTNSGTGVIRGGTDGIEVSGGAASIANQLGGTISGTGASGIEVLLGVTGTVTNDGLLSGKSHDGISLRGGGTATNQSNGTIAGAISGIFVAGGSGTVINQSGGAISGGQFGVYLDDGGSLINTGMISGTEIFGAVSRNVPDSFTNNGSGVILGADSGIAAYSGGNVTNASGGTISGTSFNGVYVGGGVGSVTNAGVIRSALGTGVNLKNGGAVVNQTGGTISAGGNGVVIAGGAGTLGNAATIIGTGDAVRFAAGFANRLIDEPGAVFVGTVDGGNTINATAVSTLELAGSGGTLSGLGTEYIDFAQVVIDPGAFWSLGPGNDLPAGMVLQDQGQVVVGGQTILGAGADMIAAATGAIASEDIEANGIWAGGTLVDGGAGTGALLIASGGTADLAGVAVAASSGGSGELTVTGTHALLSNAGTFTVGDGGVGSVAIESGATVVTALGTVVALAAAVIGNTTGASGSSVNVSGAGSEWLVTGSLVVGDAGFGSLLLSQGGSVAAGSVTLGAAAGGDGVVSVEGTGSLLTLAGTATIGNAAAGELSILAGASASVAGLTIGTANAASSGNVDVEGTGSTMFIDTGGFLNIGVVGGGSGELTIGKGTTLNFAGSISENGHASFNNNGGTVDPDAIEYTTPDNSGNGLNEYSLYVGNINAVQISAGDGIWNTPMVLTGTSVADAQNNIDNNSDVGEWQLSQGGTLVLNANTIDVGQAIVFEDATDTLVIGQVVNGGSAGVSGVDPTVAPGAENVFQAGGFEATIWGYQAGDRILFDNMFVASDTIVGGNTLEVFIPGDATPEFLTFFNKTGNRALGLTGMEAAEILADNAPCFAAGTRIATERGEVAVEGIGVGARVRVLLGGGESEGDAPLGDRWAEVIWVGRREVDCSGHKQPKKVWPVRVAAGAFGPVRPHSDVWLSPDHAVYVNEVLIPVKHLVNGTTIAQVPRARVTYHHLELATHNVLLAEGLPAESFLDMKDGSNYSNRPGPVRLYPDFTVRMWEAFGCARLVVTGPELMAARALVGRYAAEASVAA